MSYFIDDKIYIVVPTVDVTIEMVNNVKKDFYSSASTLRKNDDESKTLFKVRSPVSAVFNGYEWLNHDDILIELEKAEWQ